jgi:hypothetical protein
VRSSGEGGATEQAAGDRLRDADGGSPKAKPFTIELGTDRLTYIDGKEVTIELLQS